MNSRKCPKCGKKYKAELWQKQCDKCLMKEVDMLDKCYAECGPITTVLEDEESLEYFDRYIAGDR